MLFHVHMKVKIPPNLDAQVAEDLKRKEKDYSQNLQHQGKWRHIWRITGLYENISIFDVQSPEELHEILISLPLFPYLELQVTTLCQHSSAITSTDKKTT